MKQTTEKATVGDKQLFANLNGGTVRAVTGNSNAGQGWRPVCKGIYLGNECWQSEKAAIKAGEKYLADLEQKIKAAQLSVRPKIQKLNTGAKKNGTPSGK